MRAAGCATLHPLRDIWLLQFGATTHEAAMNICVQSFFCTQVFIYVWCMFNSLFFVVYSLSVFFKLNNHCSCSMQPSVNPIQCIFHFRHIFHLQMINLGLLKVSSLSLINILSIFLSSYLCDISNNNYFNVFVNGIYHLLFLSLFLLIFFSVS